MTRKKIIIILSVIAAIIILGGIVLYFFTNNNSANNASSSIAVYSPHENSSIVLYNKQETQYNILATSEQSANFQNLSPGTYMVSVAIKDNHACPFTQVIELENKENIVVQAEIDLNNLCLD